MKSIIHFFRRIDWPNHFMAFISTLLGVWLAFYLGNYNEHRQEISRMEVAMENVREEIINNNQKLEGHLAHLDSLKNAVSAFSKMIDENMDLVAGENQMAAFLEDHDWFITIKAKKPLRDTLYEYDSDLSLQLRYMSTSNIAWENTKLMDVLHLVKTETAFQLHGLYGLQHEAQRALSEAVDIVKNLIQNTSDTNLVTRKIINDLKGQLLFSHNMEQALKLNYEAILDRLKDQEGS